MGEYHARGISYLRTKASRLMGMHTGAVMTGSDISYEKQPGSFSLVRQLFTI